MGVKIVILLFLILSPLILILSAAIDDDYCYCDPENMKLSLVWPVSYCNTLRHTRCAEPVPRNDFKIHGLWHFRGERPRVNCPGRNLTIGDLPIHIEGQLHEQWPNLRGDSFEFWREQWRRHGVCHRIPQPRNYFRKALNLKLQHAFNLLVELIHEGFEPSDTRKYTKRQFINIIATMTGYHPEINWAEDRHRNKVLLEIVFCFDRDGAIENCPSTSSLMQSQCMSEFDGTTIYHSTRFKFPARILP